MVGLTAAQPPSVLASWIPEGCHARGCFGSEAVDGIQETEGGLAKVLEEQRPVEYLC